MCQRNVFMISILVSPIIKLNLECQPCAVRGAGIFNIICDNKITCLKELQVDDVYNTIKINLA